jgi:hypothetical protein
MPRPSLPPSMKKFCSFELLLTSTTEADIWDFFVTEMNTFEEKYDIFYAKKEAFINEINTTNPYLDCSFKSSVDRIHGLDWLGENTEPYLAFSRKYRNLARDMELCSRVLKWEEAEDKQPMLNDWTFEIGKQMDLLKDTSELEHIDTINYRNAHNDWKKKNSKFLELEAEAVAHRFCNNAICYPEPHHEGEHFYMMGATKQYFNKKCNLCLSGQKSYYETVEYEKMQEEEQAKKNAEYKKMMDERKAEEKSKFELLKENNPIIKYECKECSFSTNYRYEMTVHNNTKEHANKIKLKSWFCELCKSQSRSEVEWKHHTTTKKHKIAIGELEAEPDVYNCEKCKYTTPLKGNWLRHLSSKSHNSDDTELVGE